MLCDPEIQEWVKSLSLYKAIVSEGKGRPSSFIGCAFWNGLWKQFECDNFFETIPSSLKWILFRIK